MESFWPPSEDIDEPLYVAIWNGKYRFSDGTTIRLTEGVSPLVTEAQLDELIKHKRVKEVK